VKVKIILYHQLPLDKTCRRLASTITTDLRSLGRLESEEGGDLPCTLDTHAFRRVAETVTRYTINLVSPEWEATKGSSRFRRSCYTKASLTTANSVNSL
jgi:hypothetical protein